ncbi:MAG: cation:proton antiporter [Acidimicrobiales bacterium]
METSQILLDLLIVLVAAKVAAEVSDRIGIPAVVGEILAGVIVGPSLLGWVDRGDEVLRALGEIGVILLLLEVGMEMDVGELRKVGRASLGVAVVGVVAPMVVGYGAMLGLGFSSDTALFVGAALTATSVGITARVFGDLRALAGRRIVRAQRVLTTMGLVVLTVVVRPSGGRGIGLARVDSWASCLWRQWPSWWWRR